MIGKSPDKHQLNLLKQHLENLINPNHPLCNLAKRIPWDDLEKHFGSHCHHSGRPAKPIRLIISLLILKQLHDLSDETIVERWVENPYFQYFSGETIFQWEFPCHPADLVYFRKRIGEEGIKKILQMYIDLHGNKAKEKEVLVDTTVQEKNITFPTDTKLYERIIEHYAAIADKEAVNLRQTYKRTVKKLMLAEVQKSS
jgi:transposase, IS5 family